MNSICAPACAIVCSARSKAAATGASSASSISVRTTASRRAASGTASRRTMRSARISCSSTASRTLRVIAQTLSRLGASGMLPAAGVSAWVFLKPTRPCSAAGMRIEPPVSLPSAATAAPAATETAPPELEPPGTQAGAAGSSAAIATLAGVPWCGLMPTPEKANSVICVRPISAAPAARSRATAGASTGAGGWSASTTDPALVTWPAMS